MQFTNEVTPSDPKQIEEMMAEGPESPIYMVNLLKFRDKAEYADGRETNLTGREAYNIYAKEVTKLVEKFGGKAIFWGDTTALLLGQIDELWDEVAIVSYPSRADLWKMSTSPEWQTIGVHRQAGLKGQLNIETVQPKV
ncbi:MAG: DUF1330 domain-containing protein [Henriciella sp.]|jgi:uncharacterized protein (DUF1330 family)